MLLEERRIVRWEMTERIYIPATTGQYELTVIETACTRPVTSLSQTKSQVGGGEGRTKPNPYLNDY